MAHWLMQLALLTAFVLISASVEYRRTGLILAGFAALYLGLNAFNGMLDSISPPLYALLYAVMDYAAARLVLLWLWYGGNLSGNGVMASAPAWAIRSTIIFVSPQICRTLGSSMFVKIF